MNAEQLKIQAGLNHLVDTCHGAAFASGWWREGPETPYLVPAKLCLVHSEISEAMEGHRKSKKDDHLPWRPAVEVELADAIIRICDLAGALKLDLGGAVVEKMHYNTHRQDHKPGARAAVGGKVY